MTAPDTTAQSSTTMNLNIRRISIPSADHLGEAHTDSIYALRIHDNHLVTASKDTTVRRWDLETGRLIHPIIRGAQGSVLCLQFDPRPDQDVLIAGDTSGTLHVYKFSSGELVERVGGAHEESILSLAFDERWIVTGGRDKRVKVWSRREERKGNLPEAYQSSAGQGDVDIIKPYSKSAEYAAHHAAVNAIQLHGDLIIAGSGDRTVSVLSIQSGEVLKTFRAAAGVADLHFNGRLLLAGSSDGNCTIWNVETGEMKARIEGPRTVVRAVDAISDDKGEFTRLAIGKYDGTVQIYEKSAGKWVVKTTLEYGVQPERISNENPYVHTYEEGDRVFDVCLRGNEVFCSGQGNVVVGWTLPAEL